MTVEGAVTEHIETPLEIHSPSLHNIPFSRLFLQFGLALIFPGGHIAIRVMPVLGGTRTRGTITERSGFG